ARTCRAWSSCCSSTACRTRARRCRSRRLRRQPGTSIDPRTEPRILNLAFLHLCDSLFPIGAFAHSDGLESAAAAGRIASAADLGERLAVCLDASIGGLEGPAGWQACDAARGADWRGVAALAAATGAVGPGRG